MDNCCSQLTLHKVTKQNTKSELYQKRASIFLQNKNPKDFIDFSQVNERKTNKRNKVKSFNQIHCRFM